jgi:hypothetical protein
MVGVRFLATKQLFVGVGSEFFEVVMRAIRHPHARLAISLAGILLVLLTFVAKDDYRESMKARSEEISNAEGTFLIRTEIEQLQDVVSQSTHQRDIFHPPAFPDEVTGGWDSSWIGAEESPEEIHKGFERYAIDVRNSEVTMDNIQRLIEGVPAKPEDETTIRHIRELVNQFNGGMTELIPLAHGEESRNPRRLKRKIASSDALLKKADNVLSTYELIMHNVDVFGWSALTRAEGARTTAERDFRRWNTLSYVIQAIGVVLGFL